MAIPAHLQAYVRETAARIAASQSRFVIISDDVSAELLGKHLEPALRERVRFLGHEAVGPDFLPGNGEAIIVTHSQRKAAHLMHRRLARAKEAGCVVALALHDRRLQMHPPGWENTGIMYGGMFRLIATYIQYIPRGSYAEFGVFDGNTFAIAYHALQNLCDRFFAYDSFAGIIGAMESETGSFEDGDYYSNLETFAANLALARVDLPRVTGVKGPFQETLQKTPAEHGLTSVSVAHIDVDVYEPAKLALDYLGPVLQQGAIILFDDYDQMGASRQRGERRAVREWLAENPSFSLEPYRNYAVCGRSFIFDRGD